MNDVTDYNVKSETDSSCQDYITVSVNASHGTSDTEGVESVEEVDDDFSLSLEDIPEGGEKQRKQRIFDVSDEDEPAERYSVAKKAGCISCSVVMLILFAIIGTATAVFYHYYNLMDFSDSDEVVIDTNVTFSDAELSEVPDGKVQVGDGDIHSDGSVTNLLLIGTDERSKKFSKNARADSVMLLSLNRNTHSVRLVSLERGMVVSIPGRKDDILTHTFRYGGSGLLMKTVRTHFKVDVDKYVRVNLSMFSKLVDEVGGVDIELTQEEAYGLNTPNYNTWKLGRKVHEGVNHLNGYEALQYTRLRWIDSDFKRIERQRKVIVAIKSNISGMTVSELGDLAEECLPYFQTNLNALEFAGLLSDLPIYYDSEVEQLTIPASGTYKTLGNVDFEENAEILNAFLYD